MAASALSVASTTQDKKARYHDRLLDHIAKVPKPESVGNSKVNTKKLQMQRMLGEVYMKAYADDDLIIALNSTASEHIASKAKAFYPDVDLELQFDSLGPILKCDDDFLVAALSKVMDLGDADWKKALATPGVIEEFAEGCFQVSPSLKMLKELQIKGAMSNFLLRRHEQCGRPMCNFKQDGGLTVTGVTYKDLSYTPKYDDTTGQMTELKFRNGDTVNVSAMLRKSLPLRYNFSDWRAQIMQPPFEPVKLHVLFKAQGTGPYKDPANCELSVKGKLYKDSACKALETFKIDQAAAKGINVAVSAVVAVKEVRKNAESTLKKLKMSEARAKGMEALKRKRAQSDVILA
jgi:hypothetical protein